MPRARASIDQTDLFAGPEGPASIVIAPEVVLLRQFVASAPLLALIGRIAGSAPFRRLRTPGGGQMSVAMTNCGPVGWHADTSGYRYVECAVASSTTMGPLASPMPPNALYQE